MASSQAIAAVSQAIVELLEQAATAPGSDFAGVHAAVAQGRDLGVGAPNRVSVYLYHLTVCTDGPAPPGGPPERPPLAVDLSYLLTAWSDSAAFQQRLLGWCASVLHTTPVLTADLLNVNDPDAPLFSPGETVQLIGEPCDVQRQKDIWEAAGAPFQPSLAYVARNVDLGAS